MAKEVKNRISLDASQFQRGVTAVKRGIRDLEKGLTIDLATAAKLGGAAILALGTAALAAGAGVVTGVKGVIDLAGRLSDLSAQTGIAVSDLMILEQAFTDNGVGADKVGTGINKLQKAISEARGGSKTAAASFANLGIKIDEISELSPADQFAMVGAAIGAIEDPADRAAAAMEIFGKSGAEMLAVFGAGKIEDAAGAIGTQAKLLEKNAELFDRAGDLLGRAGVKVRGFFVGVADKVVPVILPLLEAFDKLDLAEQGQRFGEAISTGLRVLIGTFQGNQLGELVGLGLMKAGAEFVNLVARGWIGIVAGISNSMASVADSFRDAISNGLIGAAQGFGAVLLGVIAKALDGVPGLGGASEAVQEKAGELYLKAAESLRLSAEAITGAPERFRDAFGEGMAVADGVDIWDTSGIDAKIGALVAGALAAVPAPDTRPFLGPGFGEGDDSGKGHGFDLGDGAVKLGAASSLASIGGGGGVEGVGGVESLVDQSQRQTTLLTSINGGIQSVAGTIKSIAGSIGSMGNNGVARWA